ncbi:MAG: quinone oxidoreductase [Bryobacterales bacterium]|nr:quinone oxidoreductase [Bryobacterales bacterium]
MKAIQIHRHGGPEVLAMGDVPVREPDDGELRIRVHAAGVNFIDVYHRSGLYKNALPFTPGVEGAGVVEALGEGVNGFAVGDRVAWCMSPGGYAEYATIPARSVVKLPDAVSFDLGAAAMLQGLTAHYLVKSTFALRAGQVALVHAAAGGVGLLLVQMAKAIGATVIGTTSTEAKAKLVSDAGADHVVRYTEVDFVAAVQDLTGGKGVDVVYDSVGATTFEGSLKCLHPRGMLVSFGQSSGAVEPISPLILSTHGSLYLTRPNLAHYMLDRTEVDWRSGELFAMIAEGRLRIRVDTRFPLAEAANAHRALESRKTAGKLILIP